MTILACNPDQLPFAAIVVSRRPPAPEMMLVAKASHRIEPDGSLRRLPLGESSVTGDVYAADAEDELGEVLVPSDFAHQKLSPEVIVRASCHAPGKRPVTECLVGISVGAYSKRLRVVGKRRWIDDPLGGSAGQPEPFTRMPLTWANAYGGPDVANNPVGVGHASSDRLPSVEPVDRPVSRRGSGHEPAGFGPINPLWPVRRAKLGRRYDETWKATRAPFVSEDFDWSFHQSAPADQRLAKLVGDERVVLDHLHPERARLELSLPSKRVVAIARRRGQAPSAVPMVLDTLFVDLETMTLSLTWRGYMPVRELDLSDVHSVLLGLEELDAPPRPFAELVRDLEAVEADPAGLEAVKKELESRFAGLEKQLPVPPPRPEGPDDAVTAKLDGLFSEDSIVRRHVRASMAQALTGPGGDKLRDALAKQAEGDEPPPTRGRPGVPPSTGLRRRMREVAEKVAKVRERADAPPEAIARAEEAEARLRSPELARIDPEYGYPAPLSTEEPGPGADLVDRDLSGLSLAGMDLRGARLDGAVLTRADLRGADLRGASLRGALLYRTELGGAKLDGADLSRANLARVRASGASFEKAILDESFFLEAALDGARFVGARGTWPVFEKARLDHAELWRVRFDHADFGEASLLEASLRRVELDACLFERTRADGADLREASIERCVFRDASLSGAKLLRARATRSCFDRADLSRADLSLATLRGAQLNEAKLVGAELYGADLAEARLYRADLSDAVLEQANLHAADLVRTRLDRTSFVAANLYDAKLLEAAGAGADFSRANLERCVSSTRRATEAER